MISATRESTGSAGVSVEFMRFGGGKPQVRISRRRTEVPGRLCQIEAEFPQTTPSRWSRRCVPVHPMYRFPVVSYTLFLITN